MIVFEGKGIRFNYRVAGAAIKDGQVLLCKDPSREFWVLPGGRVELGEESRVALQREMREELGLQASVGRMIWVTENFFELGGKRHHELGLYYLMELPLEPSPEPFVVLSASIGLEFCWFGLHQLHALNLQPEFLKRTLVALPVRTKHIVQGGLSAEAPTAESA